MISFAGMIKAGIPAIMASHIVFPRVDTEPVGFSTHWLKQILRERLGFTGIILSDDLNMEGANISANYADRVIAAREAGCDFALLCNNRKGVVAVLDHLPSAGYQVDREKWAILQAKFAPHQQAYHENRRWHETRDSLTKLEQ